MMTDTPARATPKRYRCRVNTCPACPPFKKYPEFGGATVWDCVEGKQD